MADTPLDPTTPVNQNAPVGQNLYQAADPLAPKPQAPSAPAAPPSGGPNPAPADPVPQLAPSDPVPGVPASKVADPPNTVNQVPMQQPAPIQSGPVGPASGQAAYVPVAVPAQVTSAHPGRTQGILGIVCAIIALLLLPPLFGIAGVVLGVMARGKGEATLGTIAVGLSVVFTIIGMILSYVVNTALDEGGGLIIGPLANLL